MPSHRDESLADALDVAASALTELAFMQRDELADRVVARLRDEGVVLYGHDVSVARAAVLETYDIVLGSVALAIDAR